MSKRKHSINRKKSKTWGGYRYAALIIVSFFLCSFVAAITFVVQDRYLGTFNSITSTNSTDWRAQTFRVGFNGTAVNGYISQVALMFNNTDSDALYIVLIQNTTSGLPNGQNVSQGSFLGATLNAGVPRFYNISLSEGLIYANQNYSIVIYTNRSSPDELGPLAVSPGTYPAGNLSNTANSGQTWTAGPNDLPFIIYTGVRPSFVSTNWNYFNLTAYETSRQLFRSNITINPSYNITSAELIYGSQSATATVEKTSPVNYTLTGAVDIPASVPSQWYWSLTYTNGSTETTPVTYQNVLPLNLSVCGAVPYNTTYINFTFKDEETLGILNASIGSSTFNYWIGSGTYKKSYSFSNSTERPSWAFCVSPSAFPINLDASVTYLATNYPQRTYTLEDAVISNSVTNTILYLLNTNDGLFVTFRLINSAEQPLSGVAATAVRSISGSNVTVASGSTGADGGVTFWLNPDVLHTLTFDLAPYPTFTTSIFPTQSSYTITLGNSGGSNVSDYTAGISYIVKPSTGYLTNGTTYNFNYTISSSLWQLSSFGFNITNASGFLFASNSSNASSGGFISVNLNTGVNETLSMTYFYVINGTYTTAVRSWVILNLDDTSFSLANLVSHFGTYVGTGLFGLTSFGVGIICFVIILGFTGTLKVKFSITDEAVLAGVVFALVALLDVSFGIMPNPVGAVENFPTIFMGIIFIGMLVKEVY